MTASPWDAVPDCGTIRCPRPKGSGISAKSSRGGFGETLPMSVRGNHGMFHSLPAAMESWNFAQGSVESSGNTLPAACGCLGNSGRSVLRARAAGILRQTTEPRNIRSIARWDPRVPAIGTLQDLANKPQQGEKRVTFDMTESCLRKRGGIQMGYTEPRIPMSPMHSAEGSQCKRAAARPEEEAAANATGSSTERPWAPEAMIGPGRGGVWEHNPYPTLALRPLSN